MDALTKILLGLQTEKPKRAIKSKASTPRDIATQRMNCLREMRTEV